MKVARPEWIDPLVPDAAPILRSYHLQRAYYGCLVNDALHAEWKCPHHHRTMSAALDCAKAEAKSRARAMREWRGLK